MIRHLVTMLLWTVVTKLARLCLMLAVLGGSFGYYLGDIRSLPDLRRTVGEARDAFRTVSNALDR